MQYKIKIWHVGIIRKIYKNIEKSWPVHSDADADADADANADEDLHVSGLLSHRAMYGVDTDLDKSVTGQITCLNFWKVLWHAIYKMKVKPLDFQWQEDTCVFTMNKKETLLYSQYAQHII